MASQCREQARRVYYVCVFKAKKETLVYFHFRLAEEGNMELEVADDEYTHRH